MESLTTPEDIMHFQFYTILRMFSLTTTEYVMFPLQFETLQISHLLLLKLL